MILAQRMPFPGRREQEAPQVRMALEADAEEIPDLPLIPVRCGPDKGMIFYVYLIVHRL
jgi:hypothetical protein